MALPDPISATGRFSLSLDGLCRAVAARIAGGAMTAAMILLVWGRLRRIERRVLNLIAAIRAGRFRARQVGLARRAMDPGIVRPVVQRLPRRFGWLVQMVPYEAACFASQLRTVLSEPEMVELLAASPRLGELLRPLCRMLALDVALVVPVVPVASGPTCGGALVHSRGEGGPGVDASAGRTCGLPVGPGGIAVFGLA